MEDFFQLLASEASKMIAKLSSYTENQLPGGRYQDLQPDMHAEHFEVPETQHRFTWRYSGP